jgi:type I restriction enzyme S subunit
MQSSNRLPDTWEKDSVKSVVDPLRPITYGVVQPGERLKHGVPIIRPIIRGQDYSHGVVDDSDLYLINPSIAEAYKRSTVEDGDILFSIVGYLGQTAVVPPNLTGANITQTTARMAIRPPNQPRFFLHQFRSELFTPEIRRFRKGSAQPGLNLSDVEKMCVVIPAPYDQIKITAVLDMVDEAIGKTEAVIAKLKQLRAGLLHDLLTLGLDENGELRDPIAHPEQFQNSPLGRIPKAWRCDVLGSLVSPARPIVYGILMPGRGYPGGVPVIKVKDIKDGKIDISDLLLTDPRIDEAYRRSRVSAGDLLFTIRGTVGRMAFVPPELDAANITQDTARISLEETNPLFIARWLEMLVPKRFIDVRTIGVAVKGINLEDVRRIPVIVAPKPEQDAIAGFVASHEKLILAVSKELACLLALKSGLMNDLLTGRVRVPEGITVAG